MTTAQAATRLRVDASTVGKYIRRGLQIGRAFGRPVQLRLRGSLVGGRYAIRAEAVRDFNQARKRYGV